MLQQLRFVRLARLLRVGHLVGFLSLALLAGCLFQARLNQGTATVAVTPMSTDPMIRLETGMHTAAVMRLAVDNEKRYLVTGSPDKSVRVWNLETGQLAKIVGVPLGEQREGEIYAVAIAPNGRRVACAGWTGIAWDSRASIYIFDLDLGAMAGRIGDLPNIVQHLAYSKDGSLLVAMLGGENGMRVYRTSDLALVAADTFYAGPCYGADFDSGGNLATVCYDGYLRLYNRQLWLTEKVSLDNGKHPYSVVFSPDGTRLAIGFSDVPRVEVVSVKNPTERLSPPCQDLQGKQGDLRAVCWGSDGSLYAGGNYRIEAAGEVYSSTVRHFFLKKSASFVDLPVARREIQQLVALPDGRVAFAATDPAWGLFHGDGSIQFREEARTVDWLTVYTGNAPQPLDKPARTLQVSADGRTVQFSYGKEQGPAYLSFAPIRLDKGDVWLVEQGNQRLLTLYPPLTKIQGVAVEVGNPLTPQINGQTVTMEPGERVVSFAISRRDYDCVLLGTDRALRLVALSGQEIWQTRLPATACLVNVMANGYGAVALLGDGTLRWYHLTTGQEILAFFAHHDRKRWVTWTPSARGFAYAAGETGDELLRKHQNRTPDSAVDLLPVQDAKAPEKVARMLTALQDRQGAIIATSEAQESEEQEGHRGTAISLLLPLGSLQTGETSKQPPKLYILAIGVNDYQPPIPKLRFAAKDAQDFSDFFKKQRALLYEDVIVRYLSNQEATRKAVFEQLDWIRKQTTASDMAIIFVSGHGTNDPYGYYYFLPVDARIEHLLTTAVPFSAIQKTAASLAGRALFFIDTCRSGGAMGKKQVDIRQALGELAQSSKSSVVFASSSNEQVSLEEESWNNGAFTKALLEGLNGSAASTNGEITVYSLSLYISRRVKELTNDKQTPTIAIPSSMADFTVAKQVQQP